MNDIVEHKPIPRSAYDRLPRRYKRFIDELVSGSTVTDAMRAAGSKSRHARTIGHRLLKSQEMQDALRERTHQAVLDMGVRHERVVQELYWVATCDPRKLVNGEGVPIKLQDLPADIAACIASIDIEDISINGASGTRYKYKFIDKTKALDKLGVYLKLWDAKQTNVNVDARSVTLNAPGGPEALSGAIRLLEQARSIAAPVTAALSDTDRSVLPAALRDEPKRRGASVDAGEDSGSSGAT
jgi:hypothetical protein